MPLTEEFKVFPKVKEAVVVGAAGGAEVLATLPKMNNTKI